MCRLLKVLCVCLVVCLVAALSYPDTRERILDWLHLRGEASESPRPSETPVPDADQNAESGAWGPLAFLEGYDREVKETVARDPVAFLERCLARSDHGVKGYT